MVLYDPMERPLLQLVTSHPATDKKLFPRRAPRWAGDISKLSDAQLRSIHAFTQFGINNLRGETGTVQMNGNEVSRTAQMVAQEYPHRGSGAFGGLSEQDRRQQRYAQAEATLEQIESEMDTRQIQAGAVGTGGTAGGGGTASPDLDFISDGGSQ